MGQYRMLVWFWAFLALASCANESKDLPFIGPSEVINKTVNGSTVLDTVYHSIAEFSFLDQDSNVVSNKTFDGQIYIADFFFTSCPTICPVVKSNMLKVYEKHFDNPNLAILSHSIDTKYDTVPVLKDYAEKLNIETDKWHLVTGTRTDIYGIAKSYFIAAEVDPNAPGGYTHSGGIALIDKEGHLRGIFDGTKKEEVEKLMVAIDRLIAQYNTTNG